MKQENEIITLTNMDCLAIYACHTALDMASKHDTYVTHPALIRSNAVAWLKQFNVVVPEKAKWSTLNFAFTQTFADVILHVKSRGKSA